MKTTYKDNQELFSEYQQTKDIKLRNQIALNNIGLIYPIINRFYFNGTNDLEEMKQDAFICLLKAVEDYNPNLGYQFSTYASKHLLKIIRYKIDYNRETSLETPINGADEEDISLGDTIQDENIDIEKDTEHAWIREKLIEILTNDEYQIIKLKYKYNKTFNDIGKILGKTRQQVYDLHYKALYKIKKDKYFIDYENDYKTNHEISYLTAYDYSIPKVQTSNISSPVWDKILEIEKRADDIIKNIFKY